jgi:CBS domain-containing protein
VGVVERSRRGQGGLERSGMKDVKIREVMKSPAITVFERDPFRMVEEKFRQKGIRHLPVVDENGSLVGLVTQRDLFRIAPPKITEEGSVYDPAALDTVILRYVMKKDPLALKPEDLFSEAVRTMAEHKYGCIPIVDDRRKVVGILTETDVLKFAAKHLFA